MVGLLKKSEKNRLVALYEDRLDVLGNDVRTVGWNSRQDQELRFDMLYRGLDATGLSVLDIGCGLGDLAAFLNARTGGDYDYTGIDLSERLVRQADENFGGKRRTFIAGDILAMDNLGTYDLVFMSGALSFRIEDNMALAMAMIKRMFSVCGKTLTMNFLSSHVDFELEKNFHYDPARLLSFAKTVTPWVSLFHDYPLWEFTLQMHHEHIQAASR